MLCLPSLLTKRAMDLLQTSRAGVKQGVEPGRWRDTRSTPPARDQGGSGSGRVPEDVGVLHRTRATQVVTHRVALLLVGEHIQRDLPLQRALLRPRLLTDTGELHRREPLTEDPLRVRRPIRDRKSVV